MRTIVLALGGAAAAWVAAPVVGMTVRGTVDQRTVAGWRSASDPAPAPLISIPAQRSGETPDRVPA